MGHAAHNPEWPDKLIFAALLLVIGGALGLLFGLVKATGATIGGNVPLELRNYPTSAIVLFSAATLVLGIVGFRHQASVWCWFGVGTGIASLAFLGLVPLISLAAAVMLGLSRWEGEETMHDDRVLSASQWPDKAIIASLFLTVGGLVTLGQALLIFTGHFEAFIIRDTPAIWGAVSAFAGLGMVVGARECFKVRSAGIGIAGAVLGIVGLGFYIVGPLLAILALLFIRLANNENEFASGAAA